ncbi:glycyl-tRNA synthetase, beta subunit [Lysobacter enzymogenes]|uniref:Glycine--tRNA ligase beta subunit n=1 Tax=Lysobacter enzymogenes TaxID=69 RepID=A0A0S2DAC0_LYSEN|nr:glycine--tRNA ligase subunit beta [Lysobacter enzymogenes]ALN55488.1 glycyl-tRNA synthetase, beta subunit [Lysobacter enzymogenes]QCW24555.1 glycine--tRNA ligase subunit beta [Lysobacter enzymogenes]
MSTTQPLLIELGTEELPVKALPGLAQAFFDGVLDGLHKRGVGFDRNGAKPLYTPRRLAVLLNAVDTQQPEQRSEVLGPYLNIALDADGQPTKALQGFAAKAGVEWTALEKTSDNKGERFVHRAVKPGADTASLLGEIVREALAAMPIPKPMRWGDHDYGFARPVHWLVALLGKDVVPAQALGVSSDRMSRGHRFMHDKPVWFSAPQDYVESLRAAFVLVDPDERRERIVREVEAAAGADGGRARIDEGILEEVNGLTEWPVAVACGFEREFLAVPQEALIATMEANQKFFPVLDADGQLTERFVGVANIESRDVAEVRKGYERVIRPRFADAKFFFDEDLKQGLVSMGDGLKTVKYQDKLGSVADKVARVTSLARSIAAQVGVDQEQAARAASLSKNDLQSRMVNEFPELQGIAGRYYAKAADQSSEVSDAIDEAYMPRFSGDAIAPSPLGRVVAIAERLDTLAGGFAAGLKPTGNKDPFSLRRNALGLARTLLEGGLDLSLQGLLDEAIKLQPVQKQGGSGDPFGLFELSEFVYDRLRNYYGERGIAMAQLEAVSAVAHGSLLDFDRRLTAIAEFAKLPEAEALAAANKRSRNILKKVEGEVPDAIDPALFAEPAERELAEAVDAAVADTDPLLARRDYVAVLGRLARLRPQVDAFFDKVMVNVDDAAVRNNRLALLKRLSDRLGSVAAIEHLSI